MQCGEVGDVPVPADYYGEGKVRIAVWRPSNGMWYVTLVLSSFQNINPKRLPIPRYLNGSNNRNWGNGGETYVQTGMSGNVPLPYPFIQQ